MFKFLVIFFAAFTAFIERIFHASFTEYAMRFNTNAFTCVRSAKWACVRRSRLAGLHGMYCCVWSLCVVVNRNAAAIANAAASQRAFFLETPGPGNRFLGQDIH